ncbi:FAD-binding oxidoreductase [Rubrobacter aplysinae]|uniref:FAD-binding oxidoreductase n=1 Tax=Rubrobacter aplysinae TaxID=909625 RepID=UPI00064BD4AA|nr:FAD-binding oxidoreductase [Rubrobacter aplysinae]
MAATETKVPVDELQEIVGAANVREASGGDAIDGVAPSHVVEPGTTEEVSGVLALANERGLGVAPRGAGTKLSLGNVPSRLDLIVSLSRMDEVVEHVPGDQIIRVQAGLPLSELLDRIKGSDQILALDPPERKLGATMGGLVAANSSGPRRLRYGTVRDLIIGITIVLADGTIAKAGGKVVKNVAGYDLSKLFTGSSGALGVITETNFRLHPLPEAARTIAVDLDDASRAGEASQEIMKSSVEPSSCELHWRSGRGTLSVLIEGIDPGVEAQSETITQILQGFGETRSLSDEEADSLGPEEPPRTGDDEVALKISAFPAGLTHVLQTVERAADGSGLECRIVASAASGVAQVGLSGGGEEAQASAIQEVRDHVVGEYAGGSVTVWRAPAGVKRRVETWGPAGDKEVLIRRVKERFDPRATMSPGRFIGGM